MNVAEKYKLRDMSRGLLNRRHSEASVRLWGASKSERPLDLLSLAC